MRVAVIGATGQVGLVMLKVLEERRFPVSELLPAASPASAGRMLAFAGGEVRVRTVEEALAAQPDLALFSAGGEASRLWAPRFAEGGCTVIDNSSAWRMDPDVPLVVPEVNPGALDGGARIIANPNCSTIQLVVALKPLHDRYGLRRVVVSTYQSVTGTGYKAVEQLRAEREGRPPAHRPYPHPIDGNVLPHCDVFEEDGYTREEKKLVRESRKILGLPDLALTATAVRVPVMGGHSESVNVQFERPAPPNEVRALLGESPGVVVLDDPSAALYPMPIHAEGRDPVFVGRIRADESAPNALNLWIVSDNLRKGAATNAVQIAEALRGR
jgi:aspartate-semialdehyde dehydrogenase